MRSHILGGVFSLLAYYCRARRFEFHVLLNVLVCLVLRSGMLINPHSSAAFHAWLQNRTFSEKLHFFSENMLVQLGSVFPNKGRCIFIVGVLFLSMIFWVLSFAVRFLVFFVCFLCANYDRWERFLIFRADPSRSEPIRAAPNFCVADPSFCRARVVLIQGPRKGKALDEGRAFAGLMI